MKKRNPTVIVEKKGVFHFMSLILHVVKRASIEDVDHLGSHHGSVGMMLVAKDELEAATSSREYWINVMNSAKDRFEEVTGRELPPESPVSKLDGAMSLSSVDKIPSLPLGDSYRHHSNISIFIFPSLGVPVSEFASRESDDNHDGQSALFGVLSSHCVELQHAVSRGLMVVPLCVVQPKMHRRLLLSLMVKDASSLRRAFSVAISPRQLAMEVLQKAGLLGKFGA